MIRLFVLIIILLMTGCSAEVSSHTDATTSGQPHADQRFVWYIGRDGPPPAPTATQVVGTINCMSPLPNLSSAMGVNLARTSETGALEFNGYVPVLTIPPGWVATVDTIQGFRIIHGPGAHNAYSGIVRCKAQYPADDPINVNLCQFLSREEMRFGRNGEVVVGNSVLICS